DLKRSFERGRQDFPEILDQAARTIEAEVEALKRILQEFSDFARLPPPALAPFRISDLLSELAILYGREVAAQRLVLPSLAGDITLTADRGQMRQALINLVQNGLEATGAPARVARVSRPVFSVEERDRVRDRLLEMARADRRVVAGATVGSLALDGGDRWSDLDLTFGLAPGSKAADLLAEWTRDLEREFGAVHLFDLPFLSTIYRVFLFPGSLQVDISFTPGAEFGALGPRFKLLFGETVERAYPPPPAAPHLFGLGVHH